MTLNILCKGKESRKIIRGEEVNAFPFVYHEGSRVGQIGIGLEYKSVEHHQAKRKRMRWGLTYPRLVLTSYRGMKIAETVEEFRDHTLAYCWESMNPEWDVIGSARDAIDPLIGKKNRKSILKSVPENFEDLLLNVYNSDINISYSEIEKEIKKRRISVENMFDSNFTKSDVKKHGLEYCVGKYAKSLIRYNRSNQLPFKNNKMRFKGTPKF